jgi:hypothetical protein
MTAPGPLNGANPFTGMYQNRQFGVGSVQVQIPMHVSDFLASPPQAMLNAQAVNPLEERTDVATTPQQGIVPN